MTDLLDPAPTPLPAPGQQQMFPPPPARSASSWRVMFWDPATADTSPFPTVSEAIRDLPVAAARAAVAAEAVGEAWLLAADGTEVHVDAGGTVTAPAAPGRVLSGWAVMAARVITQRKAPST